MKTCPVCQQENSDAAAFCIQCGLSFQPGAAVPERAPQVPASALASPSAGLVTGAIVDGKYAIERLLGEGGMGIVYLARDIHTHTDVVIKAIRSEYAHRDDFRARILDEGRALARIDHINVVRLNAVVVEPDAMYLVMQYVDGETLERRITRYAAERRPMPLSDAARIFRQVVQGVGAAHSEGVIHRDIKPGNILIRQRDEVAKVTDFGIAKAEEDAKAGRGKTRGIIGSLLYMAPEQLTGRRDIDKRVDIYALGLLLYEMLVGRPPFDAPSEFELMKRHLESPVPSIARMRADVPPAIDDVIQRACAKDRQNRFSSTAEFIEALDRALAAGAAATPGASTAPAEPLSNLLAPGGAAGSVVTSQQWGYPMPVEEPARKGIASGLVMGGLALLLVALGAGFGAAYGLGWIGGPEPSPTPPRIVIAAPDAGPDTGPPRPDAAIKDSLVQLAGVWKSDSGRVYDAVLSGDQLEFRIRDVSEWQGQGYIEGEERFSLMRVAGRENTFRVSDKIRPYPPVGKEYEPRARVTCQEVWSAIGSEPLRAQYDGSRLSVDLAKIEPDYEMFDVVGNKVVGCKGLSRAKASRIGQQLTRVAPSP